MTIHTGTRHLTPEDGRRVRVTRSRVLWITLAAIAGITLLGSLSELSPVLDALGGADPRLLLLTFGIAVVFAVNMGELYRSIFMAGGMQGGRLRLILISSASHSINLVSKTSGFGGLALYVSEGQRRGDSAARVGAAYLAAYVLGYVAYLAVLIVSLLFLATSGSLTTVEIGASIVVLTIATVLAALLIAGYRSQEFLLDTFLALARFANRITRPFTSSAVVSTSALRDTIVELHDALREMVAKPVRYLRPLAHAMAVELLSAVMLYVVARAVGADIGPEVALAGYAVSLLFTILSITPAGLGFVEVSLTVFLVSFGVPRPEAVAVTLAYRFFDFWLPLAFGAISFLILRVQHAAHATTR